MINLCQAVMGFNDSGKKFVENIVEIKKIFVLSNNVFHPLTHNHTIPHFDALKIDNCGKHCEKREIALCGTYF